MREEYNLLKYSALDLSIRTKNPLHSESAVNELRKSSLIPAYRNVISRIIKRFSFPLTA